MDMGSHSIDLLEMFFGRTRRVSCFTENLVHPYSSEDTAVVLLDFEDGAKGIADALFNVPDASSRNRLEIYGSRGSILAEGTIGQGEAGHLAICFEGDDQGYDAQQARTSAANGDRWARLAPAPVNMYRAEVEAFSRSVLEGTEPPVGGRAGLWLQRVLAAAYESAATGEAVVL